MDQQIPELDHWFNLRVQLKSVICRAQVMLCLKTMEVLLKLNVAYLYGTKGKFHQRLQNTFFGQAMLSVKKSCCSRTFPCISINSHVA